MLDWFKNNVTWVLSGIGVAILTAIVTLVFRLFHRKPPTERLAQAELQTNEHAAQPIFRWTHGDMDHTGILSRRFVNEGGTVSELEAQTTAPVEIHWHPRGSLSEKAEGWVRFSPLRDGGLQFPIRFTLQFRTSLGVVARQVFRLRTREGSPERLE